MIDYNGLLRPKDYKGQSVNFIQRKFDGMRVLVSVNSMRELSVVTREGKRDFANALLEIPGMMFASIPTSTQLDCELWAEKTQATDLITLIIQRSDKIQITPFAMPTFMREDWRQKGIGEVEEAAAKFGWPLTEREPLPGAILDAVYYQNRAKELGWEGYVAKRAHYEDWYKVKPVKTADCIVMGITLSDSTTFYGDLKAVQVGVYNGPNLVEVASLGAGFTAEQRAEYANMSLLGKVCEVAYDSLAGQGRLKFPRFLRWRDDKLATECTSKQLEA